MAELGETANPRDLIPGDAVAVEAKAEAMNRFGDAVHRAAGGLGKLDGGGWTGEAAEAFHRYFDSEPDRWAACGSAFHRAADALSGHAGALTTAQARAQASIDLWNHAQDTSAQAARQHQQAADQAARQAAAAGRPAPPPEPFNDPGAAMRHKARADLESARADLRATGDRAATVLAEAQRAAPEAPTLLDRVADSIGRTFSSAAEGITELPGTLARGVGTVADGVLDGIGTAGGSLLEGLGDLTGIDGLSTAGTTVSQSLDHAGDSVATTLGRAGDTLEDGLQDAVNQARGDAEHYVIVDEDEYPEAAQHIEEAQGGMSWRGDEQVRREQPEDLTVDRDEAKLRRREALRGIPARSGLDRDEYPPAMFREGGSGASVKYMDVHDNRGSGAVIGSELRGIANGERVKIVVG